MREEPMLTTQEVMEMTRLSRQTLWRAIRKGTLKKISPGGGRKLLFRLGDVERFMETPRKPGRPRKKPTEAA